MANIAVGAVRANAVTDAEPKTLSAASINDLASGKTELTLFARFKARNLTTTDRVSYWDASQHLRLLVRDSASGAVRLEAADSTPSNSSTDAVQNWSGRDDTHIAVAFVIDTIAETIQAYECGTAVSSGPNETNAWTGGAVPALTGLMHFISVLTGRLDVDVAELAMFDGKLTTAQIDELWAATGGANEGKTAENLSGSPPSLLMHYLITKTTGNLNSLDASMSNRVGGTDFDDLDPDNATGSLSYVSFATLDSTYANEDESFDGSYGADATVLGPHEAVVSGITEASPPTITVVDHGLVVGDYIQFRGVDGDIDRGGDPLPFNDWTFRVASTPTSDTFTITDAQENSVNVSTVTSIVGATIEIFSDGSGNRHGKRVSMTFGVPDTATENVANRPTVTCTSKGYDSDGNATTFNRSMKLAFVSITGNGDGTSTILADLIPDPAKAEDGHYIYGEDVDVELDAPASWLESAEANSAAVVAGSVTNESELAYPKPIVHILTPARTAGTAGSLVVDVAAIHGMGIARVESTLTDTDTTDFTEAHTLTLRDAASNGYGPAASFPVYRGMHAVTGKAKGRVDYPVKVFPRIGDSGAIFDSATAVERPNTADTIAEFDPGNADAAKVLKCHADLRKSIDLNGSGSGTLEFGEYVYSIADNVFAYVADDDDLSAAATSLKLNEVFAPVYAFDVASVQGTIATGNIIQSGNSYRNQVPEPNGVIEDLSAPGDNPVITSVAHGLVATDTITIRDTRTSGGNPISNGSSYEVIAPVTADTFTIRQADTTTVNVTSVDTAAGATKGHWLKTGAAGDGWGGRVIARISNTVYAEIWSSTTPSDGDRFMCFDEDGTPPTHPDAGVGSVPADAKQWGGGSVSAYGQIDSSSALRAAVAGTGDPTIAKLAALTGAETLTGASSGASRTVAGTPNITNLGDDSTAVASASGDPDNPARTMRGALLAIQTARGDSKCDRGTVLCNAGFHLWGGESATALSTDLSEVVVESASGVSKAQCVIARSSKTDDGFTNAGNGARGLGVDWKHIKNMTLRYFVHGFKALKENSSTGQFVLTNVDFRSNGGNSDKWTHPIDSDGTGATWINSLLINALRIHGVWNANTDSIAGSALSLYIDCLAENVGGDVWRNISGVVNCESHRTGAEGTAVHSDSAQFFQNLKTTITNILFYNVRAIEHIRGQPIVFMNQSSFSVGRMALINVMHDDNVDPSLVNAGQLNVGAMNHLVTSGCDMGLGGPSFTQEAGNKMLRNIFIVNNVFKGFTQTNGAEFKGYVHNSTFGTALAAGLDDGSNKTFTLATEFPVIDNPADVGDADYRRPRADFDTDAIPVYAAGALPTGMRSRYMDGSLIAASHPVGALEAASIATGVPVATSASIEGSGASQTLRITWDRSNRIRSGGAGGAAEVSIGLNGSERTVVYRFSNPDALPTQDSVVNAGSYNTTVEGRTTWDLSLVSGGAIMSSDSIDDFTFDVLDPIVAETADDVNAQTTFSESPTGGEVQVTNSAPIATAANNGIRAVRNVRMAR